MNGKKILSSAYDIPESIFLVCKTWAKARSKDPRTKVGAAVYDPRTGGLFLGYNGFPSQVPDLEEVWDEEVWKDEVWRTATKYEWVVHAEANAIRKALMAVNDLSSCVLYCTHEPCLSCLRDWILPTGIKSVRFLEARVDAQRDRILNHLPKPCRPSWTKWEMPS